MVLGHQLGGLAHARAGRQVDDLVFDQLSDGSLAHGGGPIYHSLLRRAPPLRARLWTAPTAHEASAFVQLFLAG